METSLPNAAVGKRLDTHQGLCLRASAPRDPDCNSQSACRGPAAVHEEAGRLAGDQQRPRLIWAHRDWPH